jgi:hypothetical protein
VGLHFFSPANVMRLLEVVRGEKTAKDVLATVMQLARRIGKVAVVSGVCDGFIGNRMVEQYLRQAMFLLDEGATPAQVDRALEAFGMAMGPFRMSDLAGNDIGWAIRKRRYAEKPHMAYSRVADRLCEMGRWARRRRLVSLRAGSREALPDPRWIRCSRPIGREGVHAARVRRGNCPIAAYALTNEARASWERIAACFRHRHGLPDGLRLPAPPGGPMLHADLSGLPGLGQADGSPGGSGDAAFWKPAPLLELAADDKIQRIAHGHSRTYGEVEGFIDMLLAACGRSMGQTLELPLLQPDDKRKAWRERPRAAASRQATKAGGFFAACRATKSPRRRTPRSTPARASPRKLRNSSVRAGSTAAAGAMVG